MIDKVMRAFLMAQCAAAKALSADSDILQIHPLPPDEQGDPPSRFLIRLECTGVLLGTDRQPHVQPDIFLIGARFPADYLRQAQPATLLTWLGPPNVVHPNIRPPYICAGQIEPGTRLTDLAYRCFEMIGYVNWASHDSLNSDAGDWALRNQHLFPVDARPLKRLRTAHS